MTGRRELLLEFGSEASGVELAITENETDGDGK